MRKLEDNDNVKVFVVPMKVEIRYSSRDELDRAIASLKLNPPHIQRASRGESGWFEIDDAGYDLHRDPYEPRRRRRQRGRLDNFNPRRR